MFSFPLTALSVQVQRVYVLSLSGSPNDFEYVFDCKITTNISNMQEKSEKKWFLYYILFAHSEYL